MSVNIYNNNGKFIKSFNPSNKPIKMFRDEYIFKNILDNKYNDFVIVDIDKESIKLMTEIQLKEHCKILKRKYKQNKKNEEINEITEQNENIIDINDPTNIKIVDINGNVLKTITQKFYKSTYLLYKPLIENEYPNLHDVKIDDNTIKLMNEEQFKNYKKEQKKVYRETNREKLIEKDRKYNEEHKKEAKEYYEKNKDKIKEYQKKYKEKHKEEIKIKKKAYREKIKEKTLK